MEGDLAALIALLPPPAEPRETGDRAAWAAVEREIGLRLPSDFKALIATYGSGSIDEFLTVHAPFSDNPNVRFLDEARSNLKIYREIRTFEHIPHPIHPEPGGILPWGSTSNGDVLFWVTDPPDVPDRWPTAINGVRSPDWLAHPGPIPRFLFEWLSGAIEIPFFPDPPDPRFVPWPPYEETLRQIEAEQAKWQALPPMPPAFTPFGPGSPDWPPATTDAWIEALRGFSGPGRDAAAEHLGSAAHEVLPRLIELLDDDYASIWIVRAVLGHGDAAIQPLIALVARRGGRLSEFVARALGGTGSDQVLPVLVAGLSADDDSSRTWAALGLGLLGRAEAGEALAAALDDSDSFVRAEAATALAAIGSRSGVGRLHELLVDSSERVRIAAARAVGALDAANPVEPLSALLSDPSEAVRVAAVDGLAMTGAPEAATILLNRLGTLDPRFPVREELGAVIVALGRLGDPRAREPLQAILDADYRDWQPVPGDTTFAMLATAALAAIRGEPRSSGA